MRTKAMLSRILAHLEDRDRRLDQIERDVANLEITCDLVDLLSRMRMIQRGSQQKQEAMPVLGEPIGVPKVQAKAKTQLVDRPVSNRIKLYD